MLSATAEHRDPMGSLFVVTVLPLSKAAALETLTYFSSTAFLPGDVIRVPIRGKHIQGFVVECVSAPTQKMGLKRSAFQLRKITPQEPKRLFTASFLRAANALSKEYATTTGLILRGLTTDAILNAHHFSITPSPPTSSERPRAEKLVLEVPFEERKDTYARLVRQFFASKQSVLILCPTIEECEQLTEHIQKGIEHRTHLITTELSNKTYQHRWHTAATQQEPVVAIGTYPIISLPRTDIGLVILERESARAYALPSKPYLHVRDVVLAFTREIGAELLLADDVLTIDTHYHVQHERFQRFEDRERRDVVQARIQTLNVKAMEKVDKLTPSITRPLLAAIDQTVSNNDRVFLYATRKGFGSVIVCGDCGDAVMCPTCSNALSLIEQKKKRVLRCPFCKYTSSAVATCTTCGSWKLTTLGISTEQVAADLQKLRPQLPLYIVDSVHAKNHVQAKKIRDQWQQKGGVLVGTEMAIPYTRGLATMIGVTSLDSLFSLPDWRAHERGCALIYYFAKNAHTLLIQSRHTTSETVDTIARGEMNILINRELEIRKKFHYPPYSALSTIKVQGTPARIAREIAVLKKTFREWIYEETSSPRPKGAVLHTLVLASAHPLPAPLVAALASLPPYVAVATHPESLQ